MKMQELKEILGLEDGRNYSEAYKAIEFEDLICEKLEKHGRVDRQVWVKDRGDGRRGKIDLVFNGGVPIEIDRRSPRMKSINKIKNGFSTGFIILREGYKVLEV